MSYTNKSLPRPLLRDESPQPKDAPYDLVRLPDKKWQLAGQDIVLDPQIDSILHRYGIFLREEPSDDLYRLIILSYRHEISVAILGLSMLRSQYGR